jgi:hypothetical protein
MSVPDFSHDIQYSFLDAATRARRQAVAHAATTVTTGPAGADTDPATASAKAAAADPPITFDDLLDIVNPLQHLPIVSTLYRHFTHDEIKPLPKIAGDALYGGWMGLASSVADYTFEKITGKNFGDTVLAMVTGDELSPPKTAVASATRPPNIDMAMGSAKPADAPATIASANPTASQTPPTRMTAADRPPQALAGSSQAIPTLNAATLDAFMTAVNSKALPGDLSQRTLDAYRRTAGLQSQPAAAAATVH